MRSSGTSTPHQAQHSRGTTYSRCPSSHVGRVATRPRREPLPDTVQRDGLAPSRHDGHAQPGTGVPSDGRLDAAGLRGHGPGHARVEMSKEFLNEPGHAAVFAVGDIHSIEFGDDTIFIRVTGGDVETKETLRFDPDAQTVEVANRAMGQR